MPTYTYICYSCRHEFEVEQRITDEPIKTCPSCGELRVHRTISSGNFVLKGGGWFKDGYSDKSSPKTEEGGSNE
jgi:putative FmdB family regulatory protein